MAARTDILFEDSTILPQQPQETTRALPPSLTAFQRKTAGDHFSASRKRLYDNGLRLSIQRLPGLDIAGATPVLRLEKKTFRLALITGLTQ